MEISRRHHDPFHGTWRESFYQAPAPGQGVRRYLKDRPAPQPPGAKESRSRRHPEDTGYMKASDRAYKAFNQHEKSRRVGHNEIIEKRKVFRKGYDTTGPNDERYYVSASSGIGTDGSKTETDSSGREEEGNLFVKLLQNQVLNYNHSPKSSSPRERRRDKARPASPAPDYGLPLPRVSSPTKQPSSLLIPLATRRHVSKSISSLADPAMETLTKKMSGSSLELRTSPPLPSIPVPDYEGGDTKPSPKARVTRVSRSSERDVWGHVERYRGGDEGGLVKKQHQSRDTKTKSFVAPTETLKEVIKHRPPVSEVVKEIAKESERDKARQREREMMTREAEREFGDERDDEGGKKPGEEEDEAQKIYREIIEVVSSASPASLQAVRGRMVGYGEEAGATLRRAARGRQERPGETRGPGARHGGHRLRLSEDRASVTTSIDSYPFSPSSPWAQALPSRYNRYGYPVFPQKPFGLPSPTGPVSFAGFSSPSSQLTTSSLAPASMVQMGPHPPGRGQPQTRQKMKRKKKWFNIF